MDNSESWKALLRALNDMPPSTSSEISFPCTTKATGSQECVINFSMSPLSDDWKKAHTERSPDIAVLDDLTLLPAMGENEVTFGEKMTFVVGSEGGWRAINTVVELAGIELEAEEMADDWEGEGVLQEESIVDIAMKEADTRAAEEGNSADEGGSKNGKRSVGSQDEAGSNTDDQPAERANVFEEPSQPSDTVMEQRDVCSDPNHPKKKKRRATPRPKSDDTTTEHGSMSKSATPINSTADEDTAHLVEIARLCERMSKPTSTASEYSSENELDSSPCPYPIDVPKVKLVRRKANKLQCKRCLDLGTICDSQTPCSPCNRRGRGAHVCRPSEKERDAVRDFAFGVTGTKKAAFTERTAFEEMVLPDKTLPGKRFVSEKKALFFDKRGRFCKKDDAVKTVGEDEAGIEED